MAFAQFYYDPAVEFENLLDEHAFNPIQDADMPHVQEALGSPPSGGIQPEEPNTEIPRSVSSSTLTSVNGSTRMGALADCFAELVKRRDSS